MQSSQRSVPSCGHVLVLDDEPAIRQALTRFLEQRGLRVRTARNTREALEAVDSDLAAAILDVLLITSGGQSGLDVLDAIRARPETANVPVLMFTGFGLNPEVVARVRQHGAELFQKPVPFATLADWLAMRVATRSPA